MSRPDFQAALEKHIAEQVARGEKMDQIAGMMRADDEYGLADATVASWTDLMRERDRAVLYRFDISCKGAEPWYGVEKAIVFGGVGGKAIGAGAAKRGGGSIDDLVSNIAEWLGPGSRAIKNDAGDLIMVSANGTKRLRFDINRPYPHGSPHSHVEELVNGTWKKSGPIFPKDVTPE